MICPECRTANPEAARFCMNCGTALAAGADPKRTVGFELDRYLPRELLAKLESARAHGGMAGERRVVTILFCDIKGSTAAAEQLDPEEWAEVVNGAFEHMIRPVYKYEGMVPRLMGDAILAFFGAPIAHEDDPQRALLAALEIRTGIDAYAGQVSERHGVDFQVRVGIHTGLVVVGEIGSDLRLEYTAIGDAINLAARMEQTAEPGTIQISEETRKLVGPAFEIQPLGETQIKGKASPIRTFRVVAVKGVPGQVRGVEGLSSPIVGREHELALLEARVEALRGGLGSLVTVIGEAGLGKTSLLAEVRARTQAGAPVHWLEGHALSHAQSVSYFVWRQIIRQSIGARDSDAPAEVRGKLRDAYSRRNLPGDDVAFIETMLAVESEQSLEAVSGVQGEALVARVTQAVRGYACGLAAESPLVIVLDDLHWTDPASLELFSKLADLIKENRVLFVGLTRPDPAATGAQVIAALRDRLNGDSHEIVLQPLPVEKTNTLLTNLLGFQEMPRKLGDLIMSKAEGNPFFIEELIRSLIETGQLSRVNGGWQITGDLAGISLPNTLAGVLGARIDHLPDAARRALQAASVIGRTFEVQVLAALTGPGLDAALRKLLEAALIQSIQSESEASFIFRHVLVQDAAYSSILLKQRRDLHGRVGAILEVTYADRIEEFAAVLAHHFHAAADARALKYDIQAGETAERLYANAEAAVHFGRALEAARNSRADPAQVGSLFARYGKALEQCGRFDEALEVYQAMRGFAQESGSLEIEISALTALATVYSTMTSIHDPVQAEHMLRLAVGIADRSGNRSAQLKLHWNLMLTYLFSKRIPQAAEQGELALAPARQSEDREQLAFLLNDLCRVYTCLGRFEQARQVIQEARTLWQEMDNQPMLADSFGAEAEACHAAGDYEAMFEKLERALEINERIENLWGQSYNRVLLGIAYFDRGQADLALKTASEAIQFGDQSGLLASSIAVRSDLALAYGCFGGFEQALELGRQALDIARQKQPAWEALPRASLIRVCLLQGDLEGAQKHARECVIEPVSIPYPHYTVLVGLANVELAYALGDYEDALRQADRLLDEVRPLVRPGVSEVLYHKGRALVALDRNEQAQEVLNEARSLSDELGMQQALWPVLLLLAEIHARHGDQDEARRLRAQARGIIDEIAGRLEAPDLRQSFLASK